MNVEEFDGGAPGVEITADNSTAFATFGAVFGTFGGLEVAEADPVVTDGALVFTEEPPPEITAATVRFRIDSLLTPSEAYSSGGATGFPIATVYKGGDIVVMGFRVIYDDVVTLVWEVEAFVGFVSSGFVLGPAAAPNHWHTLTMGVDGDGVWLSLVDEVDGPVFERHGLTPSTPENLTLQVKTDLGPLRSDAPEGDYVRSIIDRVTWDTGGVVLVTRSTTRRYPLDSATRIYPPPRTGRVFGGHH